MTTEFYQSYIKNITTNEWLKSESENTVEHTKSEDEMLVFYEEADAESTLEYLNENFSDSYVLLVEDDPKKLNNKNLE